MTRNITPPTDTSGPARDPDDTPPAPVDEPGETAARAAEPAPSKADGDRAARLRRRRRRTIALLVGVPILVAVALYAGYRTFTPHIYSGTVMQAPDRAPSMDGLVFSDGSPVDLADFRGDVVLLYFGFTHCPDVCPTTLSMAVKAREQVSDAERVHVIMVSVDPARDDPASLGEYVRAFDPSLRGATGELEAVERVASTYGVYFAIGEQFDDGDYAVDHTATLMGIDRDGRLRIVWPTDVAAKDLAADLNALL